MKARIASGDPLPHEALPSERVVAEQEHVSRMTARRALEALELEGLAYSKGRAGRYVSPPRFDYNVVSMSDFLTKAAKAGIEIEASLLSSHVTTATPELAERLKITTDAAIFENHRLFCQEGHKMFVETEHVVVDRCADQIPDWSSMTPDQQQQLRYSALGHWADIVIKMWPFTNAQADLLEVKHNQMGIAQEQVVHDKFGLPICICAQIWRGELAQFSAQALLTE